MRSVQKSLLLAVAALVLVAPPALAHHGSPPGHHGHGNGHHPPSHGGGPATIDLPAGFSAEAFTEHGGALFVGSQVDGRILRVDVKTGAQRLVVPGREGVHTNGIRIAGRNIVAAGGTTGKISIYDKRTGAVVRDYDVQGGFVNGVAILGRTAYATDTLKHVIYAVPTNGQGDARTITPTGDFTPADIDLDGIVPAGHGQLLTGQYGTGALFTIDARTGVAHKIDLGGATLPTNDGLLLKGRTLYVAQNNGKITKVQLDRGLTTGTVVSTFPEAPLRNPVDVARIRGHLYVLNANDPQNPKPTDIDQMLDLGRA